MNFDDLRNALAALRDQNINPYDLVALDYLETAYDAVNAEEASQSLRHTTAAVIAIENFRRDDISMPNVIREVARLAPERFL